MAKKAKRARKSAADGLSVIDSSRYKYDVTKVRGSDGRIRHSRSNQDAIANALLVFTSGGGNLSRVVRDNKIGDKMKPHEDKGAGMYRMNLSNILRGLVRNGTPVTIGDVTVKKLDQNVKVPAEAPAKKARSSKPAAKAA